LGAVVIVSLLLSKIRQSLLVAYFLCGALLANTGAIHALGVETEHAVGALSDLGIVLLMFTLGIEFSLRQLAHMRKTVLLGGGFQMLLTTVAIMLVAWIAGLSGSTLLVVGFALALSSTAVSMKSFQDLGQPDTPAARMTLGIAIFQDLAVIVFMVLLPALVGETSAGALGIILALGKGICFIVVCLLLSRVGVPHLLAAVANTRSRELFTVTVVALCAVIAWGANYFGLSLALGAFAAGLIVSESIYSHRVLADVLPFKDLFLTVFFVSVGLMIDFQSMLDSLWYVCAGVAGILLLKGAIVFTIARAFGLRIRQVLFVSAALASSGEFSLVLLNRAVDLGGLSHRVEQILLACTAVSMALVPSLMKSAFPLSAYIEKRGWFKRSKSKTDNPLGVEQEVERLADHVIICGYGPVGQALHESMQRASIPVVILEMNAETVRKLHSEGVRVMYADATQRETMKLARAETARSIAFTFPEPSMAIQGIRAARELNANIVTYARAKFAPEVEKLKKEGIHHVLHDEVTSGAAMVSAVLGCYSVSDDG
ncbi:MAG: cation:proton antiporter, partial [Akkermansiaceae bacterium]